MSSRSLQVNLLPLLTLLTILTTHHCGQVMFSIASLCVSVCTGCPSVETPSVRCPLTPISHDARYFFNLVEGFQWNLPQIFILWVDIAERFSRSAANSAFHPSGVSKWVPASAGKAKAVHSVGRWTRGVQVKLWDPLRTRAIPKRLRGLFTRRRYTNPRLPYLTKREGDEKTN